MPVRLRQGDPVAAAADKVFVLLVHYRKNPERTVDEWHREEVLLEGLCWRISSRFLDVNHCAERYVIIWELS